MRVHAKLLLDVVMLDMMKSQQNSDNWCYCGTCGITVENKLAFFVEAIVISEEHQSYVFIMNALYEISGVDRSVTKLIFGDGIMSNNILEELGISESCNLIMDVFHLLELVWPKKFGHWRWLEMSPFMRAVVYYKTEE